MLLLLGKVLSKLGYPVSNQLIKDIILSKPGHIEKFLHILRHKVLFFDYAYSCCGSVGMGHTVFHSEDCEEAPLFIPT